ncbi:uncharacterized protein A1O5_05378 [Cladophialophora psammophila CBS 110553]|uniref:Dynein light chain, cytosolic n=1 Tax=Cladophialophora psammophila CBS 110553 TaxID=1182543 RepID=W9X2N0_9EURO|nr:uncharacterized protein A1O5_05378 [Cladophialophora psammophila CBS 110553]EXJ71570.1 hypothetical protein A1O5_05378 [Cladophialophora psammophila CBS 110553]
MSTLLRRVRSTVAVFDPPSPHQNNHQHQCALDPADRPSNPAKRLRLRKASQHHRSNPDLLDVGLNKSTLTLRQTQQNPEHGPLTEFRRRLARKASTFSLRGRRRQGERDQAEVIKEEVQIRELALVGSEKGSTKSQEHRDRAPQETRFEGEEQASRPAGSRPGEQPYTRESAATTVVPCDPLTSLLFKEHPSLPIADNPPEASPGLQDLIRKTQETYITKYVAGGKISGKQMASQQAPPPVAYSRLKEITEKACEAALSGVTSYSHPDTERWNTTIINSILGALVEETTVTSASGSMPNQPQFKYVVNSTIIQHAASSPASAGDDTKKTSGRRGMHAASGAYWNNEKDGMWSFKYAGADSKGLDVVVGVIWVWVG